MRTLSRYGNCGWRRRPSFIWDWFIRTAWKEPSGASRPRTSMSPSSELRPNAGLPGFGRRSTSGDCWRFTPERAGSRQPWPAPRKKARRPRSPALLLALDRHGELRGIHRGVRLDLSDVVLFTAAYPAIDPFVGHHDAGHRAVIRIIDLRGNAADG